MVGVRNAAKHPLLAAFRFITTRGHNHVLFVSSEYRAARDSVAPNNSICVVACSIHASLPICLPGRGTPKIAFPPGGRGPHQILRGISRYYVPTLTTAIPVW
jgi:hypothetical protein